VPPLTTTPIVADKNECVYEAGVLYFSDSTSDIASSFADSPANCCSICLATPNCITWSFLLKENMCFLKNAAYFARKPDSNAVSGYKE